VDFGLKWVLVYCHKIAHNCYHHQVYPFILVGRYLYIMEVVLGLPVTGILVILYSFGQNRNRKSDQNPIAGMYTLRQNKRWISWSGASQSPVFRVMDMVIGIPYPHG
jgi:hypothetical protein